MPLICFACVEQRMDRLVLAQPLHGGHVRFQGIKVPWTDFLGKEWSAREENQAEGDRGEFHEGVNEGRHEDNVRGMTFISGGLVDAADSELRDRGTLPRLWRARLLGEGNTFHFFDLWDVLVHRIVGG